MLFGLFRRSDERACGARRSGDWPAVRALWLRDHQTCACCGSPKQLEVHHVLPFHLHPDLELDEANLITLCDGKMKCHLRVGHFGNWRMHNPDVARSAAEYLAGLTAARARLAAEEH